MKTKLYAVRQSGKMFKHPESTVCSYIYLHGKLDYENGYDIVEVPNNDDFYKEDRIEDVVVVLSGGKKVNARMYLWHSKPYDNPEDGYYESRIMKKNPRFNVHGLVVEKGDIRAMIVAKERFDRRLFHT